ncbi:PucR family transcriptional regulator [Leekyejoonella antrihumi]|uniref:PucR family transcriptional regulator n=1 Tax=Leekyejoonella antrihumi TaxID=1660198 RepID=A0A563DU80_9MICO|nr:helix-turn-helix domain-containing protein [Leekyejoonella antrihumi]TWP33808.1 hypothetical protein FGL98_19695 [Leekyejoonella antrihumi]
MAARTSEETQKQARTLIADVGVDLGAQLSALTSRLYEVLAAAGEEMAGDRQLLDVLYASIESNLAMLAQVMRYDTRVDDLVAPPAAREFARRLAQRGISSNTLVRAYRLGQQALMDWALGECVVRSPDLEVAYRASRDFTELTFRYIDTISEQVVLEYESERERWMANRNTLRAAMLIGILANERVDLVSAEQALGCRLRQNHVGFTLWVAEPAPAGVNLLELERCLQSLAKAAGGRADPLFFPRDQSSAWGWVQLGREPGTMDLERLVASMSDTDPHVFAAMGFPAAGLDGFRHTHLEARRAQDLAHATRPVACRLTSYADPEVRMVALLATDLDSARRMVARSLGRLAVDSEPAARLRETLLTFLNQNGSYTATADLVYLHKNTVKYRVDKAIEERGRPLDVDHMELELALLACRWLGSAVMRNG